MRPSWLFALREAWLSGDVPDVDILEHTNHLRPFHNLYISLTGFDSDAEQRRRLMNAISSGGGTYKPTFVKSCTHLVVGPQFADHQTTLGSAKVLKAQDINALHEQKPLDQPHPIHIVWCEWLEDSRNLQGALDESKYSILNPRHLQIRVTSTKHCVLNARLASL